MIGRLLLALGLLAPAALHTVVTGQRVAPGLALLVAMGGVIVGPRLSLAQAAQALVAVGTALGVFALSVLELPLDPNDGGLRIQFVVASGTLLVTFATRLWMDEPEQGDAGTWVLGLGALFCCGRVQSEAFVPACVAYVALAWAHAAWRSPAGRHRSLRHVGAGALMVVGTAGVAVGAALGLQAAFNGATALVLSQLNGAEAGFGSGSFELTSMDGMRQSREVVLRVTGPTTSRYRGQVYQEYVAGTWVRPVGATTPAPVGPPPAEPVTTIAFASDDEERLFLPDVARAVVTTPPGVSLDPLGVPQPAGDSPEEVRFSTEGPARFPKPLPSSADLEVIGGLTEALDPLVASWTAGATTPEERVAAIVTRLEQDYTYSLHYDRDAEGDPVVQFLTGSRLGHCEYFASALVLTARTAGVPARLVTGFRSTEVSPFVGHRIVRKRDAHAWAEVYLGGAWVEVDPSPVNSLEESPAQSFLAGALDDLAVWWSRYGLQGLAGVLLVVFVALQIRTLLRARQPREPEALEGTWEGPPPWLMPLLTTLEAAGLTRDDAEPVEAFAARVAQAGEPQAGALLQAYAAHRYGGRGDAASLQAATEAWQPAQPVR